METSRTRALPPARLAARRSVGTLLAVMLAIVALVAPGHAASAAPTAHGHVPSVSAAAADESGQEGRSDQSGFEVATLDAGVSHFDTSQRSSCDAAPSYAANVQTGPFQVLHPQPRSVLPGIDGFHRAVGSVRDISAAPGPVAGAERLIRECVSRR